VRLRVNLFRHAGGLAAAVRPVWATVPTLEALHLPAALLDLVRPRTGLVLLTGATGSGKSTTLAALLAHVNRTRAAHIVTLEDPIEHLYGPGRSIVHQREVGRDVDSFASGLRAALRENPDVLLVGEMRDRETIRLALTAAETGHLVLSTLHSGNAAMAIERVLDAFGEGDKPYVSQQLAGVLRAVVAQQLLPASGGGLQPVLEVLTVNHAVAAQIREGRTHMLATQMEIGAVEGMVPFPRALAELVRAGRLTRATALAAAGDPEAVQAALDGRRG
jgi:twitching motility protein PilT